MPSTIPYTVAVVGFLLAASLAVPGSGAEGDCAIHGTTCETCVVTKVNATTNSTCVWETTSSGQKCTDTFVPGQDVHSYVVNVQGCPNGTAPTPPTPAPTTTTTPAPTTTSATTPTTSATTTVPTTTTSAPTPNSTTTTQPTTPTTTGTSTTTTPIPSSTTPTTAAPSNGTSSTAAPKPAPAPKGGFSWASFIGGIVFAAALSSVAYLIWRFYKVRLDRNYHTFSNPTF